MIKKLALKPIYLAFLVLLVYFVMVAHSVIATGFLVLALLTLWKQYDRKAIVQTLGILLVFALYFAGLTYREQARQKQLPNQVSRLRIVPDTLAIDGDLLSVRAVEGRQKYQVYYRLKSPEEKAYFQSLAQVVVLDVLGDVGEPSPKRNFKGFDYQDYLRHQGIYGLVTIKAIQKVHLVSPRTPLEWVQCLRRQLLVHIERTFPAPMKHYMTGLLLGHLGNDFDDMDEHYTELGIIHLFALSGMQVGFFIGLFRTVLLRCGLLREHFRYYLLPFAFVYAGLTACSISVIRSLLQAILGQFGLRKWDNLGMTAMLLFILSPHYLQTTGGVLSFAYAFILSALHLEELATPKKVLTESIALAVGVLPLLMTYFGTFQPLSLPLTAVFSVLFDVVLLPLLTLVLLLSPIVPLTVVNPLFTFLEGLIRGIADLSPHSLILGSPSLGLLLMMLIGLACLHDFWTVKKLRYVLLLVLIALVALVKWPLENELTVMDIGQGDSIVIRDLTGKTLLVDTGGRVSFASSEKWRQRTVSANAERTAIPYLKSRGIAKIDQIIITHTDTDHMGDLPSLVKAFHVGEVVVSPGSLTNPSFVKLLKDLAVSVRVVKAGDRLSIMGSHLQVLYPFQEGDGGNNDSLVLYGKLLNQRFLLTGDLESEGEKELIKAYPSLPVDVLKAGHHGSKGSSSPAFLEHIQARMALISAGQKNRYHHPHLETLERFHQKGMSVLRTDQQGAIRFRGVRTWSVETVR